MHLQYFRKFDSSYSNDECLAIVVYCVNSVVVVLVKFGIFKRCQKYFIPFLRISLYTDFFFAPSCKLNSKKKTKKKHNSCYNSRCEMSDLDILKGLQKTTHNHQLLLRHRRSKKYKHRRLKLNVSKFLFLFITLIFLHLCISQNIHTF